MSVYEWPADVEHESEDDPAARGRFNALRHRELDHDAALRAGRTTAPQGTPRARTRARRGGIAFAPASGPHNLWVPLGPATMIHGQAAGRPRVAGRVRALAVHPGGERLYAAAANGGVWHSPDGGASWASIGGLAATDTAGITRPAHRHACGAIAVRFGAAAAQDAVFVGTGELNPEEGAAPGSSLGGVGILVATGPAASAQDDPWTREAPNLAGHGIHRLALEPGGGGVLAATSIGLFVRPPAAGANVAWTKVTAAPFDAFDGAVTDVLWTAGDGARPARQWVWLEGGAPSGLWVRAAGQAAFTRVATPGSLPKRGVLAASEPPTRVFALHDRHRSADSPKLLPALYRVDASGPAVPAAADAVAGIPDVLRNQGFYDAAIAVDPGSADRVVIAGSWIPAANPAGAAYESYNGSLMAAVVGDDAGTPTFGHPSPPTMIGVGVHADVHDLRFAQGGGRLFAACDGGVFRSDRPAQQVGFVACNDGLAITEANYVAGHPTCEGHVVAGLQDNGAIERASTGVWRVAEEGDGGGVAFDPARPERWLSQYIRARWRSNGFLAPLRRGGALLPASEQEDGDSSFYSTPAAIGHVRGTATVGQVLVGTDRVWYTEDWGASWVTLPTGTDPITATTNDRGQDQLPEAVSVLRWAGPDVAWVLSQDRWTADSRRITRLARTPGSADAGGPGTWSADRIASLVRTGKRKKGRTTTDSAMLRSAAWTDLAVNPDAGGAQRGTKGAVYLGTAGHPDDAAVDTLWWFDGTSLWHPTGLRAEAVAAPVTAVLCDPEHPEHVYAGTTVGVWRGTRTLGDDGPDWVWEPLVNGLPEAAVEDLALFRHGGLRLLRAAIAARGVWEVELDADAADLTYVRAHGDDLRRRTPASELGRDGATARSWHGSPDVRPRPAGPVARPATLPWTRTSAAVAGETLRRFQAALRSRTGDARCRATGRWDLPFEEVLRDHGAPQTGQVCRITTAFWNATMTAPHIAADPWGAGPPSEADLHELAPPLTEGAPGRASVVLKGGPTKVEVVVHHRGLAAVDGADVRVTLLRFRGTAPAVKPDDAATWPSGPVPWAAAVNDVLNSADGTTAQGPGPGWAFALPGPSRRVTLAGRRLEPLRPGIATFALDLPAAAAATTVLLVAVIRAGAPSALAAAPLRTLALGEPTVAVRSLHVTR
jgi:hypothetical protein